MNKSVVITGGSKGIGLELVKFYAEKGYKVISGSRTKFDDFDSSIKGNIQEIVIDVTKPESHEKLVKVAINQTGKLDVYINNAGFSEWRSLQNIDAKFLESMFSTNVFGYFWGTKAASKFMKSGGSIINVSSLAARRGTPNNSAYSSSKFAITGLTQSSAKELGKSGIRVNAVCPVLIETPGLIDALKSEDSPSVGQPTEFLEQFALTQTALGRLPTSKEVAELCYFLSSDSAKAITGQSINVDCGVLPN
jgi:3-oxoacyl-[acyl-carrier protein] reductase/meso-butanediol dehydrogenase/(S,S)-butanediol dehydrogenase/diacetyl reductase